MNTTVKICGECGNSIPASSRDGRCPICMLGLGVDTVSFTPSPGGQSAPAPAPMDTIDDYEKLEMIGSGGVGVVYKAWQKSLSRMVALKTLREGSLASQAEMKRFKAEAQIAARLQHPNIVPVHEVGERDGVLFFSMEYVEGKNLAEVIGRTPISPLRAARYVRTIAQAVHYAHTRGILHRDLKPGNVLLDEKDQPRITDFGLAKLTDVDGDPTVTGVVLGTPSYMSPEQASGDRKHVSARSDIYSLGAILYDLITGRAPFRAETPVDTLRHVLESDPVSPRLLNPKVPHDLEVICMKCLEKDPAHRYATAEDLAHDLGRFLRQESIRARPPSTSTRAWRWYRRNPVLGTVVGLMMILGLLQGGSAYVLRRVALENNQNTANILASYLREHFEKFTRPLKSCAEDPALRNIVAQAGSDLASASNSAYAFLERASTNTSLGLAAEARTLVLMTLDGKTIARFPTSHGPPVLDRRWRAYYQGTRHLLEHAPGTVYFSPLFRSIEDGSYKFGLTTIVRDPEGNRPVGILALMINTGRVEDRLLISPIQGQDVMVLAPPDPADTNLVAHPGAYYAVLSPETRSDRRPPGPIDIKQMERRPDYWYDAWSGTPGGRMVAKAKIHGTDYYAVVKSVARRWPSLSFHIFVVLVGLSLSVLGAMAAKKRLEYGALRPRKRARLVRTALRWIIPQR